MEWRNWARTAACRPQAVAWPRSRGEVVALLRAAAARGMGVRVAGSGHSFNDLVPTDGLLVRLDACSRLVSVDPEARTVTVQAGMTLRRLCGELARWGLALSSLGDVDVQTVGGAIATGTHGTGARFHSLSGQVAALELVTADGSVLSCSPSCEPELFSAARLSLGALGVVTQVTFRCEPAFDLHASTWPETLDRALDAFEDLACSNDHFELFWFPHTETAMIKVANRTSRPRFGRRPWLAENLAFGAVCRLGRARPAWIPALARRVVAPAIRPTHRVDRSDRVFTTPRLVRFAEMEYALPRPAAAQAVRAVQEAIASGGFRISFPVEVRLTAAEDALLSPAWGRDTVWVAVHVHRPSPYEAYFRAVEAALAPLGGRPHWGKIHFRTAAELRPLYAGWERFAALRKSLDPEGRFLNRYLERVLVG